MASRLLILYTLLVSLLLGVPVWWITTEVYRANLPSLSSGTEQQIEAVPVYVAPHVFAVSGEVTRAQLDKLKNVLATSIGLVVEESRRSAPLSVTQEELAGGNVKGLPEDPAKLDTWLNEQIFKDLPPILSRNGHYGLVVLVDPDISVPKAIIGSHRVAWVHVKSMEEALTFGDVFTAQLRHMLLSKATSEGLRKQSYRLTFSLLNEDPSATVTSWNFTDIESYFLKDVIESLSRVHRFGVESQVVHYTQLKRQPFVDQKTKQYYFTPATLPRFVDGTEWKVDSGSSAKEHSLHLAVFVPSPSHSPLTIRHSGDKTSDGFIVPQWGGIVVHNLPVTNRPKSFVFDRATMRSVVTLWVSQLRQLVGLPIFVPSISVNSSKSTQSKQQPTTISVLPASRRGASDFEIDALSRLHIWTMLRETHHTLNQFYIMIDRLTNIPVYDHIEASLKVALFLKDSTIQLLNPLSPHLDFAHDAISSALSAAEDVFFDKDMVGMLYYPSGHELAIYLPLFLPLSFPILTGLRSEYARRKQKKKVNTIPAQSAMGNKQAGAASGSGAAASSSAHAANDENVKVAFTHANNEDGDPQEPESPRSTSPAKPRGQRARKVLRQTSVAVKKAVVRDATVTDVADVNQKDTMELILHNKELKTWPESINSMSSLLLLNLCKNQLTEIPPQVGQVSTLTRLLLASNLITAVPPEIGQLVSLEELILFDNPKLGSLPDELANCANLHVLNIARCRFKAIPECIPRIAGLLELDVSHNKLGKANFDGICGLDLLRSLKVSGNELTALPERLGRLAYLRELNASSNKLNVLPANFPSLSSLTSLELENNEFLAIPSEIGNLVNLKRLNFLGNPEIRTLPASLHRLRKLKYLVVEWSLMSNLNLREYQDKSVTELLEYLRLLADVEQGGNVTAPQKGDELRQILLENYARIVEKNKSRQMSKSDFYRSMGLEGLPTNDILERMFGAFDTGDSTSHDELVSFDEYAAGVHILLNGTLEEKATAFIRLFATDPDAVEIPIDVYINSIKSYQLVLSIAIIIQQRHMDKIASAKSSKRASQRAQKDGAVKKSERDEIMAKVTHTDFWRTPEMQRVLDEAQETFDAIDIEKDSSITKVKLIRFMKAYEGNEIEELLKSAANWLIHGVFQSPELLIAKGKALIRQGQKELGLELLKDAIEAAPNRLLSYEELMQFYRSQKAFDKALKVGKMALAVDAQALFILDLMGRIYGDAGRLPEAVDAYQKVIDVNPEAAPTIYRQAWYQVALGKFKEAQANVTILDNLKYEAGAATIRYLVARASKESASLVEKLGKRAARLNPENQLITSLVATAYSPTEDSKAIFGA